MKVNIGPHVSWIGPYQISKKFEWLLGEYRADKIGDWLIGTWVGDFCSWLHKKKKRKIKVHIDGYDAWCAEHTIALIVHPILLELQKNKAGAPYVEDEDVPLHLRSISAPPKENDYDVDDNHFVRWDWVLNEMIWTFAQYKLEDRYDQFDSGKIDMNFDGGTVNYGPNHTHTVDDKAKGLYDDRLRNGLMLFAKYYESLWD